MHDLSKAKGPQMGNYRIDVCSGLLVRRLCSCKYSSGCVQIAQLFLLEPHRNAHQGGSCLAVIYFAPVFQKLISGYIRISDIEKEIQNLHVLNYN